MLYSKKVVTNYESHRTSQRSASLKGIELVEGVVTGPVMSSREATVLCP